MSEGISDTESEDAAGQKKNPNLVPAIMVICATVVIIGAISGVVTVSRDGEISISTAVIFGLAVIGGIVMTISGAYLGYLNLRDDWS
ncbi:hypothetical protein KOR42_05270 [Thalassoglobus neptunius]|uniref:Uncharacterized protein n=1 Tax=Thalassoglobus neptunius TaxID=1938619 RepID=A0A5C5X3L8_9PLAN|nr:hypothetical protein [Thalassoglobus neptunius]TWT57169.1 hypothetical protein KOR42_05270 [Thalassoglobus neptunius]